MFGTRAYACCTEHAGAALLAMDGTISRIRHLGRRSDSHRCYCKKPADFVIIELDEYQLKKAAGGDGAPKTTP